VRSYTAAAGQSFVPAVVVTRLSHVVRSAVLSSSRQSTLVVPFRLEHEPVLGHQPAQRRRFPDKR
jgi:hypothetical protein